MIIEYNGHRPNIHESCFVAENATLIGQVTLRKNVNIWYGALLRGDDHYISIGENQYTG